MSQHFRFLNEAHVKSLLPMPELDPRDGGGARALLRGRRAAAGAHGPHGRPTHAFFGVMPAYIEQPGPARHEARHRLRENDHAGCRRIWPPSCCSIRIPARSRPDGRPLHHRGAHRRRVGGLGAPPRARGREPRWRSSAPGVQARSHLEALAEVRTLTDVRVWSPRATSRERFVARWRRDARPSSAPRPPPEEAMRAPTSSSS